MGPGLPNIAKFEEMVLLILGKRFKKQPILVTILLTTFKHSREWWQGRVEEILHQTISFASSSFINNIKSTNYNFNVLIFKLQSLKKTLTVKYHEAYTTRTNSPIMW